MVSVHTPQGRASAGLGELEPSPSSLWGPIGVRTCIPGGWSPYGAWADPACSLHRHPSALHMRLYESLVVGWGQGWSASHLTLASWSWRQ